MSATLYDYAASGNCLKVRLLFGLLGLPYRRVEVDIYDGATLTDEYAAHNPLRETPVLQTSGGEIVTQSNAILWLLAEGTAFLPATPLDRARVVQWLLFEQERVMPGIANPRFRLLTGRAVLDPAAITTRQQTGREALTILDGELTARPFLVGATPTIADLSVYAQAHAAEEAQIPLAPFPAVRSWIARVEALPGFVNDLAPYPSNAALGASRSIYDPAP